MFLLGPAPALGAPAALEPAGTFDHLGVRELIEREGITSVQAFLERARAEPRFRDLFERRHQFVVYRSGSRQRAAPSDPANPRVLLVGERGRYILTYSARTPFIEVLQFNEKIRDFEFRLIDFTTGKARFSKHDDLNDGTCRGCHAGRPNWDTYPMWPGFYGGSDNLGGANEFKLLSAFESAQSSSPFYSWLARPGQGHFLPVSTDISRLNTRRIVRILQSYPAYSRLKHAVLAAASRCDGIEAFAPSRPGMQGLQALEADVSRRHRDYFDSRMKALKEEAGYEPVRPNIESAAEVAALRYIAQFFGLRDQDRFETWSTSLPDPVLGYGPGEFMAFQTPAGNFLDQFKQALLESDPQLARGPRDCAGLRAASLRAVGSR